MSYLISDINVDENNLSTPIGDSQQTSLLTSSEDSKNECQNERLLKLQGIKSMLFAEHESTCVCTSVRAFIKEIFPWFTQRKSEECCLACEKIIGGSISGPRRGSAYEAPRFRGFVL